MTIPECPRCGDQTLWSHNQGKAWCRLCGHTWDFNYQPYEVRPGQRYPEFRCDDPEGDWIKDQQEETP